MVSGLDTESLVSELVSAYSKKTETYTKEQTKLSWKQDAWKSLNTKVYSLYTNASNMRFSSAYVTKKASSSDNTKATVSATGTAVNGTQKLNVLSTAQSGYMTGGKLHLADNATTDSITSSTTLRQLGFVKDNNATLSTSFYVHTNGEDKEIALTSDSTLSDVVAKLKDAGLDANFDENQGRIYISSKDTGTDADFTLDNLYTVTAYDENGKAVQKEGTTGENGTKLLTKLGLLTYDGTKDENDTMWNGTLTEEDKQRFATKIDGADAQIRLNDVLYTSSSNIFDINGLSITAAAVTGDGEDNAITITTDTDTQAIYDKIKDFLTEYNSVINEMTKLYNADSSYGYDPLTDDEKDAMSDTEIEKWETKIKDSLLRRDTTLNSIMSSMMNTMASSIEIDGKKYSFSSFGIRTLGYLNAAENEQNAYHIDGDEEDENTSGNEDKLMAAIKNNPDTIVDFMKQMTQNLYKVVDSKMKSTSLSSAYKIYNDKELDTQYKNYTTLISDWEDKVSDKEDYYYNKFSQMESALSKLESQTSSLTGLLGS
jgi:flagellar hook-associated protein 2